MKPESPNNIDGLAAYEEMFQALRALRERGRFAALTPSELSELELIQEAFGFDYDPLSGDWVDLEDDS